MIPSLSYKSLSIAVAAIGITGLTPGDDSARARGALPGTIAPPVVEPAAKGKTTRVMKAPDGLFYVTMHVNGHPTRFVVDTGANVVVLTSRDAQAAGVSVRAGSTGQTLRTAGGGRAMRWATIERLTIAGRTVSDTDAVVMTADGPPHSLLGQSALEQFSSVTIRGDALELTV